MGGSGPAPPPHPPDSERHAFLEEGILHCSAGGVGMGWVSLLLSEAGPAWCLTPGPDGGAVGASWLRRSPEGLLGPFRKTSLGLLIPQPLALPLSGTTLGSGPSALEGDQEPASSVFSGSPAPPEHPQVPYTPGALPGPVPSGNQLPPRSRGSLDSRVDPGSLLSLPPSSPFPLGVASLGLGRSQQCAGGLGRGIPQLILSPALPRA